MEDLAREMLDTIALYQSKADYTDTRPDGSPVSVLATRTSGDSLLYLYIPPRRFLQPAREAENRYGLTGLAGHYKMPDGITPANLESYTQILHHAQMRGDITNREMQQKMQRTLDRLTELNPQLKDLRPDPHDFEGRYDALMGVASDFNVKDMNAFLSGNTGTVASQNPAWAAQEKKLNERGVFMTWIPTMETMQGIDSQLDQRDARARPGLLRRLMAPGA